MTATEEDIRDWFIEGKRQKATHLVVACDTWDYDNYPIYVKKGDDVHKIVADHSGKNMQIVDEVYNLSMDMDEQLKKHRVFNY